MEPRIDFVETIAWTTGVEQAQRTAEPAQVISSANLATNIFQKQGGNWFIVHHHAPECHNSAWGLHRRGGPTVPLSLNASSVSVASDADRRNSILVRSRGV